MHVSYDDILDRIPEPPLWWLDGVPRYKAFGPAETSVYAFEALLVEAKCQHCQRPFTVGLPSLRQGVFRAALEQTNDLPSIGDPPRHDCDGPGNSMNMLATRVLEFWERVSEPSSHGQWRRVPALELAFPPD